MCMCAWLSLFVPCVGQVPTEAWEGIKFPGTKVAGSCNESSVGAETTCGPLKEH